MFVMVGDASTDWGATYIVAWILCAVLSSQSTALQELSLFMQWFSFGFVLVMTANAVRVDDHPRMNSNKPLDHVTFPSLVKVVRVSVHVHNWEKNIPF